ncbi:hypothetical protein PINS_up010069 [Pythium insidiosum]|nr:hypothetical protein PINS_up010069 [Pythium insidiosum]
MQQDSGRRLTIGEQVMANLEAHALETDALVTQNISTRQELERWIQEQKSRLLREKREHEFHEQEHTRLTADAEQQRSQLQRELQELRTDCDDHERQVSVQQVEIEVLQVLVAQINARVTAAKDDELKRLTLEAQAQQTSLTEQLNELTRGLEMYARLGLSFEQHNAEQIIVRFTQIDAQNPAARVLVPHPNGSTDRQLCGGRMRATGRDPRRAHAATERDRRLLSLHSLHAPRVQSDGDTDIVIFLKMHLYSLSSRSVKCGAAA